jgi:hypothetical protein
VAKVLKYGDVSKIESDFKPAPVGVYHGKVESIQQVASKSSGDQQFEVVFQLTKDANGKKLKQKYGQLWYYAPVDVDASWARRLKELVAAFGLKPKGGNLATIEGKECLLRLREDTDLNGDYRPNIGKLMKLQEPEAEEGEDEDDEDDEDEESEDDLDGLSRAALKKIIKDEELDVTVKKSMSEEDIAEAIREARPEDEEPEDEDEDDEEEDDDDEEEDDEAEDDNYDEMSIKALRQELSDRELETKGKKEVLIARLRTDDVEEPV